MDEHTYDLQWFGDGKWTTFHIGWTQKAKAVSWMRMYYRDSGIHCRVVRSDNEVIMEFGQ